MNKEFLLELYSGEIPSLLQEAGAKELSHTISNELNSAELTGFISKFFHSSRRISLLIENLEPFTKEQKLEQRGPKITAPPQAIEAFAKAHKLEIAQLEQQEYKGEIHYFHSKYIASQRTEELLSKIVEKTLAVFSWPKSMKWDESNIKWIRPLHNILAIYNEKIVPINFGNLKSNDHCYGHFFIKKEKLQVANFASYSAQLKEHHVMFDQDERRKYILTSAKAIATKLNLELIEDDKLLEEVSGLIELPNLIIGTIDQKFLSLPIEVLVCSIRTHQKYFCLKNEKGEFANKFIVVANSLPENDEIVIRGNERVLSARLNDAIFFYKEDLKTTLLDKLARLEKIAFHHKLGNLKQKIERIIYIAVALNHQLKLNLDDEFIVKTCQIAKSDLTAEMVGEFPELQGVMGYYYALEEKYDAAIALAIKEQYLPRGPGDKCPNAPASIILSLADKFDSLFGLFLAGEKPTGSKDSFGLRRLALGIVRILIENKLSLNLDELLESIRNKYKMEGLETAESLTSEVKIFIIERLCNYLKNDYDYKILDSLDNINDIYQAKIKLDIISTSYKNPTNQEAFSALKRALKFNCSCANNDDIKTELFTEEIEKTFSSYINENNPGELEQLLKLEAMINGYFDSVIINHDNEKIKTNRHNFIKKLQDIILGFANFAGL